MPTPLSLLHRFTLVSLVVIIFGMAGIGWQVGEQIRTGVIKESAITAALYMDSFIAPNLQELSQSKSLTSEHAETLNNLLHETELGSRIVAFKVWDEQGNVLYSKGPSLFSDVFPNKTDLARVWQGEVVANISDSQAEKNLEMQLFNSRLLQTYSPVRLSGTNQTIAIAEFYQKADALEAEIGAAQRRSWLMVAAMMLGIYLALVGFVRWAGNTIERQQLRVQRAAANASALNERFLRRISAELHDGPTQELGLSLLLLDRVISENQSPDEAERLTAIQIALQHALQEMRDVAAGFGLPHLERLTCSEILSRVVRAHERRTNSAVKLSVGALPNQAPLPLKITAYRFIQEALNNAYRHAGGAGQQARVSCESNFMLIEISDEGAGFDAATPLDENHLGLAGMRERVESLGGLFKIESEIGRGTKVTARLPL